MSLLSWFLRPHKLSDEERADAGARLDAKRRHLRGKMSRTQGEIRRSWTSYRTWRGDEAGKRKLKAHIRALEAERKEQVKEMLRLQSEMKKVGYDAVAGEVEIQ